MNIYSIGRRIKIFFRIIITGVFKSRQDINMNKVDENLVKEDERVERWYYENGNLKAECYYLKNKLDGISFYYYEEGGIKAKETYKDDYLEGLTKRYNEDGSVGSEEYYHLGKLIEKKIFDKKGNIINK